MFPSQYGSPGLVSRGLSLTKGINWSGLLDGAQKTLGVINQAIPIVYQIKPIIANAKTVFKIANVMNESSTTDTTNNKQIVEKNDASFSNSIQDNRPIFYI